MDPYKKDMPEPGEDLRAAWAIGFSRAAEISGIGFQFVLPTLAGWWLDQKLNTPYVFLGIGITLGLLMAFFSLLHIVKKK
ncbi:MAG: AtpZ/AtpI family protein [Thermoguttaceae bacterium]|nr:AtpZ/AtpI family protein [Thermoguttaceae bacterium]